VYLPLTPYAHLYAIVLERLNRLFAANLSVERIVKGLSETDTKATPAWKKLEKMHKMYVQQGITTLPRKESYVCGQYRNTAKIDRRCSTHYIRKSVLNHLVLSDINRVLGYVRNNKELFLKKAQSLNDKNSDRKNEENRQFLIKFRGRLTELDAIFRKLYEDSVFGRINNRQFVTLTSGYDAERESLSDRIAGLEHQLAASDKLKDNTSRFVGIVEQFEHIDELNYDILHKFIDKILIHDLDRTTNRREIEIFYNFVGKIDGYGEKPENEAFFRQLGGGVRVKSIVI